MLSTQLVRRLGQDTILQNTNGNCFINFNVVHSTSYKNKDGVKVEKATWVQCSYFLKNPNSEIAKYLKTGTIVALNGIPEPHGYFSKKENKYVSVLKLKVNTIELISAVKKEDQTIIPVPEEVNQVTTELAQEPKKPDEDNF